MAKRGLIYRCTLFGFSAGPQTTGVLSRWTQGLEPIGKGETLSGEVVELFARVAGEDHRLSAESRIRFDILEEDFILFFDPDDRIVSLLGTGTPAPSEDFRTEQRKTHFQELRPGQTPKAAVENFRASRWKDFYDYLLVLAEDGSPPAYSIVTWWQARRLADWLSSEFYFIVNVDDVFEDQSGHILDVSSDRVRFALEPWLGRPGPAMHSGTFPAVTPEVDREGVEFETAFTLSFREDGEFDGRWLYRTLREGSWRLFRRLRRCPRCEAYALGFGIDQMPWDEERHQVREKNPFVWLTIEGDRFEIPDPPGPRRQTFGTDLFDDYYFDTRDFIALENGVSIRARKRWRGWRLDDDPEDPLRRMLIAVKLTRPIDPRTGLKQDEKIDTRLRGRITEESVRSFLASVVTDVQGGFSEWPRRNRPAGRYPLAPLQIAYRTLAAKGVLPDIGRRDPSTGRRSYQRVLGLEPKAFLRQPRSRYHFNEARIDNLRQLYRSGEERLGKIADLAAAATPPPSDFIDRVRHLRDRLLVERAAAGLEAIDAGMTVDEAVVADLLPDRATPPGDLATLRKMEIVAKAIHDLFHQLAAEVPALRVLLTGAPGDTTDGERFRDWQRRDNFFLRAHTTFDRFADKHAEFLALPASGRRARLAAYNRYGGERRAIAAAGGDDRRPEDERWFADFEPLDEAGFAAIAVQLRDLNLEIWKRQIEAAGSAAIGLWFDRARRFFVPASTRSSGNFFIDTIDVTGMFTADAWGARPLVEQDNRVEPEIDKLFHGTLVNEVQIELDREKVYGDRIATVLFLLWATETGHPDLAAGRDDAAYRELFRRLRRERPQATVDAVNDFAATLEGSLDVGTVTGLPPVDPASFNLTRLTVRTFEEIDHENVTLEPREPGTSLVANLRRNLAGAVYVFAQYRHLLTWIGELKRDRVLEVLQGLARHPQDLDWVSAEASKGETALTRLRERAGGRR